MIACLALAMMLSFGSVAFATLEVEMSDNGSFIVKYETGAVMLDSLVADSTDQVSIKIDNHTFDESPGAPALPRKSIYFASPHGVVPTLDYSIVSSREYTNLSVAPVPELVTGRAGFTNRLFKEDEAAYARSGYLPKEHVLLEGPVHNKSVDVWELVFTPMRYDAFNKKGLLAEGVTVSVSLGDISGYVLPSGGRVPQYVVNASSFKSNAPARPGNVQAHPFDSGDWYRIEISESGMYQVTGTDLRRVGFPSNSVPIDQIRMYYNGGWMLDETDYNFDKDSFREIAVSINDINDNGVLDGGDSVRFYGESLSRYYGSEATGRIFYQNHLFSDTNVYWLTVSKEGAPVRIGGTGETPGTSAIEHDHFREHIHLENELQNEWVEFGKEWYWHAVLTDNFIVNFSAPGYVSGTQTSIDVGILNQEKENRSNSLDLYVYLEGESATSYTFSVSKGFVTHRPAIDLKEDGNHLILAKKYDRSTKSAHLDYLDIEYTRRLSYAENNMDFFHLGDNTTDKFIVQDVKSSNVEVFDITDPYVVKRYATAVYDAAASTLTFQGTYPDRVASHFLLANMSTVKKPDRISKADLAGLRNVDANYIIITHNDFMGAAQSLASWRGNDSEIEPLTTYIVDYMDIFDEFNGGVYDPLAFREFLHSVWVKGGSGRNYYCCIIGDAIYKYKNLTENQANTQRVPSYSSYMPQLANPLTTDDYFCWFDMNMAPEFSMGRLCVTDVETANAVVEKIINYEKNPEGGTWRNRVLLVADDEFKEQEAVVSESMHVVSTEKLDDVSIIPNNFQRKKLIMFDYPMKNGSKPEATEDLISYINDGYLIFNFTGHGNETLLAHEHILVGTRDLGRFSNAGKMSLFLAMSCLVGNYTQLENPSLAEMLMLKRDGGMLGSIAASHKTFPDGNETLNIEFMKKLFYNMENPEFRIGKALSHAKVILTTNYNSKHYVYLGDPASCLMIPRYSFSIAQPDTVYKLERIDLSGTVSDDTSALSYNGKMTITARAPKIKKTHQIVMANSTRDVDYTQPGKVFFTGEYDIEGSGFDANLVVPKDTPTNGDDSVIYYFAEGGNEQASAAVSNFAIGGLDPDAPDDTSGPEIAVSFDGKMFEEGDYIGRQPVLNLSLSDPSGINVVGQRGHNISLLIDKQEIIVLTENFKSLNGYESGMLEYTLPALTTGEHEFELTAYDTYNNATRKTVTAYVVGSDSGDITIMDLLNYPNPMADDGTTFTFRLTDDAREATIKVYSQAGRLVDSMRFPASYGFNMVEWKPPFSIANGVYFYKLSVKSLNGRKASKIEKLVMMK